MPYDDPTEVLEVPAEPQEASASLSGRMEKRAAEIEQQITERFPIPGWEDILEVELKALGYSTIRKVIERNNRIRDVGVREVYSMADQLLRATVGFWEVENGERRPVQHDWVSLASHLPSASPQLTPRQALLLLIGEKRIHFLIADWADWARSVRPDVDEELRQDFVPTG